MSVHPADAYDSYYDKYSNQYGNGQPEPTKYGGNFGNSEPAVITQPPGPPMPPGAQQNWMPTPAPNPGVTPGLEYLSVVDQILVHQKVELLEALIGFESANKYAVTNALGQDVYMAIETNDGCTRNCCGTLRPFTIKVMNNYKREIMSISRPLKCDSCCFPCCLQDMDVTANGNSIGHIIQVWNMFSPKFNVTNTYGDVVLKVEGPFCTTACCGDVEFKVLSPDGHVQVGKISKQWSGLGREAFTDADNFGISFPMDLDTDIKGVLLGACFLIDFMFYEGKQQQTPGGIAASALIS